MVDGRWTLAEGRADRGDPDGHAVGAAEDGRGGPRPAPVRRHDGRPRPGARRLREAALRPREGDRRLQRRDQQAQGRSARTHSLSF